jgi:2-amino-4-hydroxy-6-hydroxymethyldihydropteridine diphosphokinase
VDTHQYLIAVGSNRRSRHGSPRSVLGSVCIDGLYTMSRIQDSAPLGPGMRRYANAVALVESDLAPPAMLDTLKGIERAYGRRRGRRWGDRVLDLDIVGWSGGIWTSPGLAIPHPSFRARRFVLAPLAEIAPDWRDPVTHMTARQLLARLDRKRPRA